MANVLPAEAATSPLRIVERLWPQPLVGGLVALLAVTVAGLGSALHRPTLPSGMGIGVILALAGAVTVSRLWPLRIGSATRLCVADVPLYLLCCLCSPVVAAVSIALGMLGGEIVICRKCGNTPGDVASQVGRWMLLGYAVSSLVHGATTQTWPYFAAGAAMALWLGDVLTAPVVFSPITGKDPLTSVLWALRQSWPAEPMQYLIAMLALLVLGSDIVATGLGWMDILGVVMIIVPIALLYVYLRREDELRRTVTALDAAEAEISL
jgi:hypothetical protein